MRFTWRRYLGAWELQALPRMARGTIRRQSRPRSIACRRHRARHRFVDEGKYRISRTIHLWSGIRLIGYGAHRPVFVLGANTPGFQEGHEFLGTGRYMLQFASRRPAAGEPVVDANEFYVL